MSDDRLVLELAARSPHAPDGFRVEGSSWCLDAADVDRLRSTPGLNDAVRPYPALVTLGSTADDAQVVADLEALRLTSIESDDRALVDGVLAAIAVELSCSPWAEDLELMLVGTCERLPEALGRHTVTSVADLDARARPPQHSRPVAADPSRPEDRWPVTGSIPTWPTRGPPRS